VTNLRRRRSDLNQVSATFNVLIIGLGGELGIHFCLRYAELAAKGRSRTDALGETGATMGSALFSSAVTTAIGFLVFWPTDYRGVAELGLIAGAGVLLSLAACLTLLPALLALGARTHPYFAPPSLPFADGCAMPVTHARPIRWAALAVAVVARADPRASRPQPVNLRDPSTESCRPSRICSAEQHRRGRWIWSSRISPRRRRRPRVGEAAAVERALTLVDYVPTTRMRSARSSDDGVPGAAAGERSAAPDAAAQIARAAATRNALAAARADRRCAPRRERDAPARCARGLRAALAAAPAPGHCAAADQRRRLAASSLTS
jgi:hypothetical protein